MSTAELYQLVTLAFLVTAMIAVVQITRIARHLEQIRDVLHRDEVRKKVAEATSAGQDREAGR